MVRTKSHHIAIRNLWLDELQETALKQSKRPVVICTVYRAFLLPTIRQTSARGSVLWAPYCGLVRWRKTMEGRKS
jgi:hypothetical protein